LSEAFAVTLTVPATAAPTAGAVMLTLGGVLSKVAVTLAVPMLPAASRAVTVSTFDPDCRAIPLAVQLVIPLAIPEPPRLFVQVTWVTPTLSDAVPCRVREELAVVYAGPDVGDVIAIVGFVVSAAPTPRPVTTPVMVPPFAVKLIVALTVVVVVGVKRTFTACVAPAPNENGLPETIVNGKGTDALPDTVPPAMLDTV
jgi:hypothetical protein